MQDADINYGAEGQLDMTVEVMSILPGVYLVDIAKTTGDTVDFYNAYAKITELVQPLITADALRRADSGAQAFLKVFHDSPTAWAARCQECCCSIIADALLWTDSDKCCAYKVGSRAQHILVFKEPACRLHLAIILRLDVL